VRRLFPLVRQASPIRNERVPRMEWVLRGFLLAAIVAVTVFLFVAGWRRFQEFQQFREREVQLVERISAQRTEFARQQEYHRRLLNDPAFLEAVVRDRLGYVRDEELLFRFEESGEE